MDVNGSGPVGSHAASLLPSQPCDCAMLVSSLLCCNQNGTSSLMPVVAITSTPSNGRYNLSPLASKQLEGLLPGLCCDHIADIPPREVGRLEVNSAIAA
jgi:hypothetical protein